MCLESFALRPTRALGRVLRLIGSPDTRVAMETAVGFQDWGSPKPSCVFPRSVQPSCCDVNVSLLLENAPVRNKSLVSKPRNHHPHSRELWEQGLLAAVLGALGPDVTLDEVPDDVFLCLKFPVLQRSSSGKFEVRACADAGSGPACNRYNELWVPPEKLQ